MSGDLTLNKYAAAILATALGFMLIKEVSHSAMHIEIPETPAYALEMPEPVGPTDVEPLPFPQTDWVAGMDAARGAKVFKKCTSCHNADDGGKNGTGPNLWDVVGKAAAQRDGFAYSGAMKNSGLTWDFETLDQYLTKPTKFVSGTNMNFVGIKKGTDRAAVIELLRLASTSPIGQPVAAASNMAVENETETPAEIIEDAVEDMTNDAEAVMEDLKDEAETIIDKVEEIVEDAAEEVTGGDH